MPKVPGPIVPPRAKKPASGRASMDRASSASPVSHGQLRPLRISEHFDAVSRKVGAQCREDGQGENEVPRAPPRTTRMRPDADPEATGVGGVELDTEVTTVSRSAAEGNLLPSGDLSRIPPSGRGWTEGFPKAGQGRRIDEHRVDAERGQTVEDGRDSSSTRAIRQADPRGRRGVWRPI